jgi:hypothetical protein
MYHCAVPQPQVEQLTCENTSTHWHSQAPDKPTRAPFATQSATHLDLADEPSDEVVNFGSMTQLYAFTVSVHGLRPQTVYGRRAAPRRAARRRRFWTGCTQTEPWYSPWGLMIPVRDGGRPCGAILSTRPLISPGSSPSSVRQRYPSAPPRAPHGATIAGQRRDRRAARAARPRESRLRAPEDPGRAAQARLPGQRVHERAGSSGHCASRPRRNGTPTRRGDRLAGSATSRATGCGSLHYPG